MHQAMLNGHVQQSVERKTVATLAVGFQTSLCQLFVERSPNPAHIIVHSFERGPIRRLVGGQASSDWVDPEGEQTIELRMKTLQAQHVLVKQVPVKRLKVSYVKDDA